MCYSQGFIAAFALQKLKEKVLANKSMTLYYFDIWGVAEVC